MTWNSATTIVRKFVNLKIKPMRYN